MPGPLPYFRPGESAFPALNADVLNSMVAGIRGIPNSRPKTGTPDVSSKATVECYVINNTSATYDVHSIMVPSGTASAGLTVTSDQEKLNFQRRPLFTVTEPAASTDFPFVLLEPLRGNSIARAAIGGIAVCTVNITDAAHGYANPTPGDWTRMTSGATGQVRILHKPTGTGIKVCAVYLLEQSGSGAPASGGFTVHYWHSGLSATPSSIGVGAGQRIIGLAHLTFLINGATFSGLLRSYWSDTPFLTEFQPATVIKAPASSDTHYTYPLSIDSTNSLGVTRNLAFDMVPLAGGSATLQLIGATYTLT